MLKNLIAALSCMSACVLSTSVHAQEADDKYNVACLAFAQTWSATSLETAAIKTTPVPESFSKLFENTICGRFSLVETSLIDWHRDYGTEASLHTAIGYLSDDILRDLAAQGEGDMAISRQINGFGAVANYYFLGAKAFNSPCFLNTAEKYYEKARVLLPIGVSDGTGNIRIKAENNWGMWFAYTAGFGDGSAMDLNWALKQLGKEIEQARMDIEL